MKLYQQKIIKESLGKDTDLPKDLFSILSFVPVKEMPFRKNLEELFLGCKEDNVSVSNSTPIDLRIQWVAVKNFRKYGDNNGDLLYGISFQNKIPSSSSHSIFILGDNGSGKSTLFEALEYIFTGNVSEAKYRKIDTTSWYIMHGFKNVPPQILVKTMSGYFSINNSLHTAIGIDPNRFFFTEFGIQQSAEYMRHNGEHHDNWLFFFCHAIGLNHDLLSFSFDNSSNSLYRMLEDTLHMIKIRLKDDSSQEFEQKLIDRLTSITLAKTNNSALRSFADKLGDKLSSWPNNMDLNTFDSEIKTKRTSTIPAVADFYREINDIKKRWQQRQRGVNFSKKLLSDVDYPSQNFEEMCKKKIMDALSLCHHRLQTILDGENIKLEEVITHAEAIKLAKQAQEKNTKVDTSYIESLLVRIESFRNEVNHNVINHLQEIIDDDFIQRCKECLTQFLCLEEKNEFKFSVDNLFIDISIKGVPIHKYFNTFRYRLFCMMIQALINVKMMKVFKFRFPMVFDDIFYANDYKNKDELFRFFDVIMEYAKKELYGDKLQIIFFTHDEQFYMAMHKHNYDVSFARLISPDIAEKLYGNIKKYTIDGKEGKFINCIL